MPSKKNDPAIEATDGAMPGEDGGDGIAQGLIEGITSMLQHPEDAGPDEAALAPQAATDDTGAPQADEAGAGEPDATPPKKKAAAKKPAAKKKAKAKDDAPDAPLDDTAPSAVDDSAMVDMSDADDDALDAEQTTLEPVVGEQPEAAPEDLAPPDDAPVTVYEPPARKRPPRPKREAPAAAPAEPAPAPRRRAPRKKAPDLNVLKIDAYSDIETPEDKDDLIWHEIHNAYRTRRILTGLLGGVEKAENGVCRAVIEYKGFRIMITMDEMMILLGNTTRHAEPPGVRMEKRLNTMIYSQVDFIVKGIDSKTRSVVASRKDAMMKKRQVFYMNTDAAGSARIHAGRVVQARIIGVFEKIIRVEVFGVECAIIARDLSWEWIGDARQHYSVGDTILVRINEVKAESADNIAIAADARSIRSPDGSENLKKCRVQGKYAGTVTDVRRGTVLVRLSIGVNAIAHSCFDNRVPGKKDDVSFVVTHIEEEKGVAMGIITRIIRQNL